MSGMPVSMVGTVVTLIVHRADKDLAWFEGVQLIETRSGCRAHR